MLSIKYLFIVLGLITGLLFSCQDDEVLNLKGYPQNTPTFSVEGSNGESNVYLSAIYQKDRKLKVNGEIRRNYTFHILPSPEDVVVSFSPICTNIPKDKIDINITEAIIPAGFSEVSVTVGLKDNDFTFAEENLSKTTYELGVKANIVKGINISGSSFESKVIIDKEAFLIQGAIDGKDNNTASFERTVDGDCILNSQPISYRFKLKLDKPSIYDIKCHMSYEGIDERFLGDIFMEPSEIVIPAGKTESKEIVWSMKDDFVLSTESAGVFDFYLSAVLESQEEHLTIQSDKNKIHLRTSKSVKNIRKLDALDATWVELERNKWKAFGFKNWSWNTEGPKFFDGDSNSFNQYSDGVLRGEFIVDLQSEKNLKGIQLENYFYYSYFYSAKDVRILTSVDNDSWINHGEINDLKVDKYNNIQFVQPVKARYVKFSFLEFYNVALRLAEIRMYE